MIAGEIGKEFQEELPSKIKETNSLYLVGDNESILKPEKIEAHKLLFQNANCVFKTFEGKHEVNKSAIDEILNWLND
jgi:predicted esterase